jgi:hypothetical protein
VAGTAVAGTGVSEGDVYGGFFGTGVISSVVGIQPAKRSRLKINVMQYFLIFASINELDQWPKMQEPGPMPEKEG